jgi:hypothetical protein
MQKLENLQEELTQLISKKLENLNIVNIDELIENKREEIKNILETNQYNYD